MPDENDTENESPVISELRAKAKRVDDLEPEVTTLRQENAILKAGITDLTPARQKALLAAHEGDLDAEALRKTAVDLGFLKAETPAEEEPQVPADEQAAHQRIAETTGTAPASEAEVQTMQAKIAELRAAGDEKAAMAYLEEQGMLQTG